MNKRELIEQIVNLNPTATPVFLSRFNDADLAEYLRHLAWVVQPPTAWKARWVGQGACLTAVRGQPAPAEAREPATTGGPAVALEEPPAEDASGKNAPAFAREPEDATTSGQEELNTQPVEQADRPVPTAELAPAGEPDPAPTGEPDSQPPAEPDSEPPAEPQDEPEDDEVTKTEDQLQTWLY